MSFLFQVGVPKSWIQHWFCFQPNIAASNVLATATVVCGSEILGFPLMFPEPYYPHSPLFPTPRRQALNRPAEEWLLMASFAFGPLRKWGYDWLVSLHLWASTVSSFMGFQFPAIHHHTPHLTRQCSYAAINRQGDLDCININQLYFSVFSCYPCCCFVKCQQEGIF